jgi:hypothetical protein
MRQSIVSCFSQPKKPIKEWVGLLKSLKINAVFLNSQGLNNKLLASLKDTKIKVFLEFGVFSNDPILWGKIPSARVISKNGKVLTNLTFGRKPVCPSNPKVKMIKLERLKMLTKIYTLDGVWFDGLRFPGSWEKKIPEKLDTCFCPNCLTTFAQDNRVKPPSETQPSWPLKYYPKKWYQWRTSLLISFLEEARKITKNNNSLTQVGIFVIPLIRKEFNNAIIKVFGQDITRLSQEADFISPMLYHRMKGQKVEWIGKRIKYFSKLTQKPILPTIQTRDMPESLNNRITADELKKAVALALSPPSRGIILFTLDNALAVFKPKEVKGIINQALS